MLVRHVLSSAFAENCWVLAPGPGEECVVVDPGVGVLDGLLEVFRTDRLRPSAILLTHGHVDHIWSVTPVCRSAEPVPAVHVHPDDAYRLRDPLGDVSPELRAALVAQFGAGATWQEPEDVVTLPAGAAGEVRLASIPFTVTHTPGHTEGSVVYGLAGDDAPLLLSGDLLFAGSVGRTDLPGGDPAAMARSLATALPPLPGETLVLPGHGPTTTMATERATNPFLTARV